MAIDIKVLSRDAVTGRLTFLLSSMPVTGMDLLVQIVVLSLLNTPGQDVLTPNDGGGIPEMIGLNIDATDSTEVIAEVSRRTKKTQTEVINAQAGLNILDEERLKAINVVGIKQGDAIDEVLVVIRIINAAGRITDIVV
jgi:hypothetical protein